MQPIEQITGKIIRIFYQKNSFSIGIFKVGGKLQKFVGNLQAELNREVTVCGKYEKNKYGKQFYVQYVKPIVDLDLNGLVKYLAIRPDVKGVGPVKAHKIVDKFGSDFQKILLSNPKKIINFANLPEDSIDALKKCWKKSYGWNQVYTWLASFDLSYFQIKSIIFRFGSDCLYFMKKNPYELIEKVDGVGFIKMDEIALKLGFENKFEGRLLGALIHSAKSQLKQGHCWTEESELKQTALRLLALDDLDSKDIIDVAMKQGIHQGRLSFYHFKSRDSVAIGLTEIMQKEENLAEIFGNQSISPYAKIFGGSTKIAQLLKKSILNEMQQKAVQSALESSVSIISGGAGTGKTFTLKTIADIYKKYNLNVIMAAPTGKAARRIKEVTNLEAFTLHKLLGYNGLHFRHENNEKFNVEADVLIVDEVSMIDVELFCHIFHSFDLSKTCFVLVGDHNQLPPVGPGNVLRDLMAARPIVVTVLTEVMRQAGILKRNSSAVLTGTVIKSAIGPPHEWYVDNLYDEPMRVRNRLIEIFEGGFDKLGYHPVEDVQVLSPTNKGPIGAEQLNLDIRRVIQKKLYNVNVPKKIIDEVQEEPNEIQLLKNDKVIQTVNDYKTNVMNGEIGFIVEVEKSGNIYVKFNSHSKSIKIKKNSKAFSAIQLAYCLSIHKVQGSQFPCVISIIHKSHSFMHHQNLLYTAVTRAEKTSIILGDKWGIEKCASKRKSDRRRTFLNFFMPPLHSSFSVDMKIHGKKDKPMLLL